MRETHFFQCNRILCQWNDVSMIIVGIIVQSTFIYNLFVFIFVKFWNECLLLKKEMLTINEFLLNFVLLKVLLSVSFFFHLDLKLLNKSVNNWQCDHLCILFCYELYESKVIKQKNYLENQIFNRRDVCYVVYKLF